MIAEAAIAVAVFGYIFAVPVPAEVEDLQISESNFNSAELRWDKSKNAKSYRVYRSKDGEKFDYVATTTDTKFKDEKLRTGDTYYYSVTARNGLKRTKIETNDPPEVTPSLETPALNVDLSDGKLKLSYSHIAGALGYEISRDGEVIGTSETTSFIDENADGEPHDYQVKAYRYIKEPVYSRASNKVAVEMQTIDGFTMEMFEGDLNISWAKNYYYNDYKLMNGDQVLLESTDTEYTIENYEKNKIYDLKLVGFTSDDKVQSPEVRKTFEIIEEDMNNEQAIDDAIRWGVKIAGDNTFTYGTGKRSHRYGCYFCQTNVGPRKNIKGKSKVNGHSYEKTYCCNPFVHACYAHGTGDPAMMKACLNGKGIAMSKKSFTRYGNWKHCGKVSKGNLKKGDVLVRENHVMLYIGDGNIVHAAGGGWDAGSIQVCNLGNRKYSFVMRYTGTGRGHHDVIRYVDENNNLIDENGNVIRKADVPEEEKKAEEKPAGKTDKPAEKPADNQTDKPAEQNTDAKPEETT